MRRSVVVMDRKINIRRYCLPTSVIRSCLVRQFFSTAACFSASVLFGLLQYVDVVYLGHIAGTVRLMFMSECDIAFAAFV